MARSLALNLIPFRPELRECHDEVIKLINEKIEIERQYENYDNNIKNNNEKLKDMYKRVQSSETGLVLPESGEYSEKDMARMRLDENIKRNILHEISYQIRKKQHRILGSHDEHESLFKECEECKNIYDAYMDYINQINDKYREYFELKDLVQKGMCLERQKQLKKFILAPLKYKMIELNFMGRVRKLEPSESVREMPNDD